MPELQLLLCQHIKKVKYSVKQLLLSASELMTFPTSDSRGLVL